MILPDKETFSALCEDFTVIPIYKTVPADLETPISVYLKTAGSEKHSFLLESGDLGEQARYSFIGRDPFLTLVTKGNETVIERSGGERWCVQDDPLDVLQEMIRPEKIYLPAELEAFWGGAAGYVSYDLARFWEKLPGLPEEAGLPSLYFFFPRKIYIYDHRKYLLTGVYLLLVDDAAGAGEIYQEESRRLQQELAGFGIHRISDVLFASLDTQGNLLFQEKSPGGCGQESRERGD